MASIVRLAACAVPLLLAACGSQETGRGYFFSATPLTAFSHASAGGVEDAAGGGDPASTRLLGDMYYWADLVEGDRAKAQENWTVAAQGGDALAVERLDAVANGRPIQVMYGGGGMRRFFNQAGDSLFTGLDDEAE